MIRPSFLRALSASIAAIIGLGGRAVVEQHPAPAAPKPLVPKSVKVPKMKHRASHHAKFRQPAGYYGQPVDAAHLHPRHLRAA